MHAFTRPGDTLMDRNQDTSDSCYLNITQEVYIADEIQIIAPGWLAILYTNHSSELDQMKRIIQKAAYG
jgi:hypothetical protein